MSKPQIIWVVMEPKRGDHNRISSTSHISEADAVRKALRRWLPEEYFPYIPGDSIWYGELRDIWAGMKKAGWDLTEVEINQDGENV